MSLIWKMGFVLDEMSQRNASNHFKYISLIRSLYEMSTIHIEYSVLDIPKGEH